VGQWLEEVCALTDAAGVREAFAAQRIDGFLLSRLEAADLDDITQLSRLDKVCDSHDRYHGVLMSS
jgi:hypothetical protein